MSRTARTAPEVLVGTRVNLLPPEVAIAKRDAATRRRLGIAVLGAAAIAAAAVGGSVLLSIDATSKLEAAQDRTIAIIGQQSQYAEARTATDMIASVGAARQLGATTEVNVKSLLAAVDATLPPGVSISSSTVNSTSPIRALSEPTGSLEPDRIATLLMTAQLDALGSLEQWITTIEGLTGHVSTGVSSARFDESTGQYAVDLLVAFDDQIYSGRYQPVDEAEAVDTAAAEEEGSE
jgi:hypothetical protein